MTRKARVVNRGENPAAAEKARIELEGLVDLGDAPVDLSGFTLHLMIVNPCGFQPGWLLLRRTDRVPSGELAPGKDWWQASDPPDVWFLGVVSAAIVAGIAPHLAPFVVERTRSLAADLARLEGMGSPAEELNDQADKVGKLPRWALIHLSLMIQGHTDDEAFDMATERVGKRELVEADRPLATRIAVEWYEKVEAESRILADALLEATGCENLVALAKRGDILGALDPDERRAIELRFGLDLIRGGDDGKIRFPVEVGKAMGLSLDDADALLDSGLALLIPGYPETVWPEGRTR